MGPTLSFFQQSAREAAQNNQQKGFQEGYLKAIEDFSEALKTHIEDVLIPKTRTEQAYRALSKLSEDDIDKVADEFKESYLLQQEQLKQSFY